MTKVRIQAVELQPTDAAATADGDEAREIVVLEIDLAEFTQGAQFGEISEAIQYAQDVVRRESKRRK